jgi:hypothetical protein
MQTLPNRLPRQASQGSSVRRRNTGDKTKSGKLMRCCAIIFICRPSPPPTCTSLHGDRSQESQTGAPPNRRSLHSGKAREISPRNTNNDAAIGYGQFGLETIGGEGSVKWINSIFRHETTFTPGNRFEIPVERAFRERLNHSLPDDAQNLPALADFEGFGGNGLMYPIGLKHKSAGRSCQHFFFGMRRLSFAASPALIGCQRIDTTLEGRDDISRVEFQQEAALAAVD